MKQKGLAPILIAILTTTALVGSFYLGMRYQLNATPNLYDNPSLFWSASTDQLLKDWHIYINPRFKFAFKYPKTGVVNEGSYLPVDLKIGLGSTGGLLSLYPTGDVRAIENKLYDTSIIVAYKKIPPETKTINFAKQDNEFGGPIMGLIPDENYHTIVINGHEATIVDYVLTDEIDKKLNTLDFTKKRTLPAGYKTKIVYIRSEDYIFVIKAGSLLYKKDEERFDQILSTFKFLP